MVNGYILFQNHYLFFKIDFFIKKHGFRHSEVPVIIHLTGCIGYRSSSFN